MTPIFIKSRGTKTKATFEASFNLLIIRTQRTTSAYYREIYPEGTEQLFSVSDCRTKLFFQEKKGSRQYFLTVHFLGSIS